MFQIQDETDEDLQKLDHDIAFVIVQAIAIQIEKYKNVYRKWK